MIRHTPSREINMIAGGEFHLLSGQNVTPSAGVWPAYVGTRPTAPEPHTASGSARSTRTASPGSSCRSNATTAAGEGVTVDADGNVYAAEGPNSLAQAGGAFTK
jgi:hypothetical protein